MAIEASVDVDLSRFEKKIQMAENLVLDAVREGMADATRGGIRAARSYISLRSTQGSRDRFAGKYESAAGPGRSSGREDTGNMMDSVSAEVYTLGQSSIIGRVGWLDNVEKYFELQEEGFWNYKAYSPRLGRFVDRRGGKSGIDRKWTPGMFIWRDVRQLLQQTASGLISIKVKAAVRKIR